MGPFRCRPPGSSYRSPVASSQSASSSSDSPTRDAPAGHSWDRFLLIPAAHVSCMAPSGPVTRAHALLCSEVHFRLLAIVLRLCTFRHATLCVSCSGERFRFPAEKQPFPHDDGISTEPRGLPNTICAIAFLHLRFWAALLVEHYDFEKACRVYSATAKLQNSVNFKTIGTLLNPGYQVQFLRFQHFPIYLSTERNHFHWHLFHNRYGGNCHFRRTVLHVSGVADVNECAVRFVINAFHDEAFEDKRSTLAKDGLTFVTACDVA